MYIEPNSTIKILKNVPLDTTYDHTLFFGSRVAQNNYFSSMAKYTLNNQTYQRVKRGYMNVKIRAENLYDCNYLMFQNTGFGNAESSLGMFVSANASIGDNTISYLGTQYSANSLVNARIRFFNHNTIYTVVSNTTSTVTFTPSLTSDVSVFTTIYDTTPSARWFYAFIKSVEYINNEVSQIEFEIDEMQTWFFDYNLDMCYVEREHSLTDEIGDNLVEENLSLGTDYVVDAVANFDMNDMNVLIVLKKDAISQGDPSALFGHGHYINGTYFGLELELSKQLNYTKQSIDAIDAIFRNYTEDQIVNIIQFPRWMSSNIEYPTDPTRTLLGEEAVQVENYIVIPNDINGYTPKNNKLFTHPYISIQISNNCGEINEYKWELSQTHTQVYGEDVKTFTFRIAGAVLPTPEVLLYPRYYAGIENNYDEGITYTNFPVIPWSSDQYKTWWAENKSSYAFSQLMTVINGALNIGVGAVTGNAGQAVGGGLSIINKVGSDLSKIEDLKRTPTGAHGLSQSNVMNCALGKTRYTIYKKSIRHEYARIVDEYFTRYGYATKRNKIPNRNVRPHWTYTKTIGCTITGSIPADSARKICDIYNAGITFWNNPIEVGNYSLNNSPV